VNAGYLASNRLAWTFPLGLARLSNEYEALPLVGWLPAVAQAWRHDLTSTELDMQSFVLYLMHLNVCFRISDRFPLSSVHDIG
jgi:hypothetical protein